MRRAWIGVGILLITQLGTAVIARVSAPGEPGAFAAAALMVVGVLAIAALNARHTAYPRWAYVSMVVVMGAAMVISPAIAVSPASWTRQTRDILWMFPWFLVLLSFLP